MARTPLHLTLLPCAALALVVGAASPSAASAQAPCAPPAVDTFTLEANLRAGQAAEFGVNTRGDAATVVDWGDGTTSPQGPTTVEHTYARPGEYRIVATATSACGAKAAGATTVTVYPACDQATDRSVAYDDCSGARSEVRVAAGGRRTRATPLSLGACAETGVPAPVPAQPVPVARAACIIPADDREGPPKVPGRLRAFRGTTLTIRLGAPAIRVDVALGSARRRQTDYVKAVRADALGRVWRIELGTRRNAATRLYLQIDHRGIADQRFVAGIRVV